MRALRIELRRSGARTLAALVIVLGGLLIAFNFGYWRASSAMAAQELSMTLPMLIPLALALGAVHGRREKRTRAVELMESTGRPRWQRFLPSTAALGGALIIAFLLVTVACTVAIAAGGGHLSVRGAMMPLIDALLLAGAAWLGIAAGRAWSSPILPPLLAAVTLVLLFISPPLPIDGRYSRWSNLSVSVVPPSATRWETPTTAALLAQLALAAGLVTAGLLLIGGRSWLTRAGTGAALAAGLAGLLFIAAPGPAGKWRLDPAAQRLVCQEQVCVTAVHAYLLPGVVPEARRALDALAVLPGAPTRVAEIQLDAIGDFNPYRGFTPDDEPGTVYLALGPNYQLGRDPGVAQRIAMGGGTYLSHCGPREDADLAMSITGAWLLGTDDFRVWDPILGYQASDFLQAEIRDGLRALRALPEPEQLARVTAVRDAAQRCAPDLMAPLTGEAAS